MWFHCFITIKIFSESNIQLSNIEMYGNIEAMYMYSAALKLINFKFRYCYSLFKVHGQHYVNITASNFDSQIGTYSNLLFNVPPTAPDAVYKIGNIDGDTSRHETISVNGTISRDQSIVRNNLDSIKIDTIADAELSVDFELFGKINEPNTFVYYVKQPVVSGADSNIKVEFLESDIVVATTTTTADFTANEWHPIYISYTPTKTDVLKIKITATNGATPQPFYISDISSPLTFAVNTGDLNYWAAGTPTNMISSNYTSASDIWAVSSDVTKVDNTIASSMLSESNFIALKGSPTDIDSGEI